MGGRNKGVLSLLFLLFSIFFSSSGVVYWGKFYEGEGGGRILIFPSIAIKSCNKVSVVFLLPSYLISSFRFCNESFKSSSVLRRYILNLSFPLLFIAIRGLGLKYDAGRGAEMRLSSGVKCHVLRGRGL